MSCRCPAEIQIALMLYCGEAAMPKYSLPVAVFGSFGVGLLEWERGEDIDVAPMEAEREIARCQGEAVNRARNPGTISACAPEGTA